MAHSTHEVAILGAGWVGKAQHELFPGAYVYDEPQIKERYEENFNRSHAAVVAGRLAVNRAEVAFVCVPSPNLSNNTLDSSVVEEVVGWCESDVICIRSTLNPGDADRLKEQTGKRIVSQPEYLGESVAHPMSKMAERPFMVLGGDPEDRRKVIETYQGAYNANISIRQVTNYEAEVIKLSENRAIAHKVAEIQELYDACEAAGVDFYTIRDAVYGDDPRFNLWFSFVYPDKRGMESKCIPKDVLAWTAWAWKNGKHPKITQSILEQNEIWTGRPNNPNALNHNR